MNADVQGMAKWIKLNQTGNSCASVQFAFPAVVASYAMILNLSCALDIVRQQQLTINCMGNMLLGLQMFLRSTFAGSELTWAYCSLRNEMEQNEMKINRNENLQFAK